MKLSITLLMLLFFFNNYCQEKTIMDVLIKNTSYAEKVYEIEMDTSIMMNSDTPTVKRYLRWRSFLDSRIDSIGTLDSYLNCLKGLVGDTLSAKSSTKSALNLSFTPEGPFENNMNVPNYIGRADFVKLDPGDIYKKKVFVGSNSGGLFKTDDIYADPPIWTSLTDNWSGTGALDLVIDPTNSNVLYMANSLRMWDLYGPIPEHGLGVLKSDDGGNSWYILDLPSDFVSIKGVELDPNNHSRVFAVSPNSLLISENEGVSWIEKPLPTNLYTNFYDIAVSTQQIGGYPSGILVYGKMGLCYSTDMGDTWIDLQPKISYYGNFYTQNYCRNTNNKTNWNVTEMENIMNLNSEEISCLDTYFNNTIFYEVIFTESGKVYLRNPDIQ